MTITYDAGFYAPRLADHLLEDLQDRGLAMPSYEPGTRLYLWPDTHDGARAVAYLRRAWRMAADDATQDAIEAHRNAGGLRQAATREQELSAHLRPYQRAGVAFLVQKQRAILADAMGLGKTVQALDAIEQADAYPAVVVAPAGVKSGWHREVLKWMPWRSAQVLQPGRDKVLGADLTIVNPELLGRHLDALRALAPRCVVLDEAHYFKNPHAQRSLHARTLVEDVPYRFALTGTPIKNRREDLLHQLRLLDRVEDVLGIYRGVLPHWWKPDQHGHLQWVHAMTALERLDRRTLRGRLRDVCLLRRTKEEVATDLPPLQRITRDVDLSAATAKAYQASEDHILARLGKWAAEHALDDTGIGVELRAGLTQLRREAAMAKVEAIAEWGRELAANGERAVIFAYHKRVVHAVAEALPGKPAIITGDTPPPKRRAIIDGLDNYPFLVCTMDATGHGVDGMQMAAGTVAFAELDWTPTKHEQCEGRLHRIGQTRPVDSWYFLARGTIEEAMMRTLESKWADIAGVVEDEEAEDEAFLDAMVRDLVADRVWEKRAGSRWS